MARLTARERRESYLREYSYQKKTGKQFFPYATFHDIVMNLFFVLLIVGLTIVWHESAGPGPADDPHAGGPNGVLGPLYEGKADPAVEEYDPKPEWYFFFLFQLLRIFNKPELLLIGATIIPTIWMVLLIGMPFIDRSRERRLSRRPISLAFATGMAVLLLVLTWNGSKAPGAAGAGSQFAVGINAPNAACANCHTLKDAGWNRAVGPVLDTVKPDFARVKDALENGLGGGAMPAFPTFTPEQIDCMAAYVASAAGQAAPDFTAPAPGGEKSATDACAGVTY